VAFGFPGKGTTVPFASRTYWKLETGNYTSYATERVFLF